MLPAAKVLAAGAWQSDTRTLAEACQGLPLRNHCARSIAPHKLSTVLTRTRDRNAIRNACTLVCHTHYAGTPKHQLHRPLTCQRAVERVSKSCVGDAVSMPEQWQLAL